jgi:dTMP kinase
MAATRGSFIVLEGLDRSGKTTQSEKLLEYFRSQGREARIRRFPGNVPGNASLIRGSAFYEHRRSFLFQTEVS